MSNEETQEKKSNYNQSSESHDSNAVHSQGIIPTSGRRLALRGVRRQLTDEELSQPGVQKLLLDMLEEAETDRDNLQSFVVSFHEADKKASVLGEKLNADKSIETLFGVGVGLGGAILGLAPFFWSVQYGYGLACIFIGIFITIGATVGRLIKR